MSNKALRPDGNADLVIPGGEESGQISSSSIIDLKDEGGKSWMIYTRWR